MYSVRLSWVSLVRGGGSIKCEMGELKLGFNWVLVGLVFSLEWMGLARPEWIDWVRDPILIKLGCVLG